MTTSANASVRSLDDKVLHLVLKPDRPVLILVRIADHAYMATRKHQWMVDDQLWELIAPLIPPQPSPRGPGGRPRIDDRATLKGILVVLYTGCRWRDLPVELGCGSGHTAWRQLRQWQQAGVWEQRHQVLLEDPSEEQILDWSRARFDSVSVRTKRKVSWPGLPDRLREIEGKLPTAHRPQQPDPASASCKRA